MPANQIHIQERLGSAIKVLATIEQRASNVRDDKVVQRLADQCRRLMTDLERGFLLLQEATSEQLALKRQAEAAARRAETLFELSPLASLVVLDSGEIINANAAATTLLNISRRNLQEKSMELFVNTDRAGFLSWLRTVAEGTTSETRPTVLRPRERRLKQVTIVAAPELPGRVSLVLMESESVYESGHGAGGGEALDGEQLAVND